MMIKVDDERAEALAALEDGLSVAAGSLLPETFERQVQEATHARERVRGPFPTVFSNLISMTRRNSGLSIDELAQRAQIDPLDLYNIESFRDGAPEPRVVSKLAKTLQLPVGKLMQLVGHVESLDPGVSGAALRFAASSGSMQKLTKAEKDALNEFVKSLSEA